MGNNPISRVDPDGGFDWYKDSDGNNVYDSRVHSQSDIKDLGLDGTYIGKSFFDFTTFQSGSLDGVLTDYFTGAQTSFVDAITIRSSSGLNLDKSGFSQNKNITKDRIPGLENGRPAMGNSIEAIILHRTVSSNYPGGWMKSRKKIKGAHFYVDTDGTAYQTASLNTSVAHIYASSSKQMYKAYFKKLLNSNTIGIEVVGNYQSKKWDALTEAQTGAVKLLVKQIKSHYKVHNIYPHETVQRKTKGEGQTVLDAINN